MDLRWMSQGGLLIDGNGDLAGTLSDRVKTLGPSPLSAPCRLRNPLPRRRRGILQHNCIQQHAGDSPGRFSGRSRRSPCAPSCTL
jgi:hypothetical protein